MPSRFLGELPEEPMVVRDLSGVGYYDVRAPATGGDWPARPPRSPPDGRPVVPPDHRRRPRRSATGRHLGPGRGGPRRPPSRRLGAPPRVRAGRIVAVDGAGPNRKGRVAFAVGPERTFVLAKSPLRTVGRGKPDGLPPRRASGETR